jgi:hypothetical protein
MTVFQKVTRSLNHRKDKQGSRILNESESVYILKPVNDQTVERQGMDLLHSQYQALLEISERSLRTGTSAGFFMILRRACTASDGFDDSGSG